MSREPFDLLDQVYTVAYWMTGSLKKTNELVYKTYQQVDAGTSEVELFKTLRSEYYNHFFYNPPFMMSYQANEKTDILFLENHRQESDGKLAVLFSEVCKLKHRTISKILDKPVERIRLLLTSERKTMLLEFLNLAFFSYAGHCYV